MMPSPPQNDPASTASVTPGLSRDSQTRPLARLALADGSVFHGQAFGLTEPRCIDGEVCFNTSLTGYQEILTDPSYAGQIVTMTYPLIGNYGVNVEDLESTRCAVRGFVVRELANVASNYRSSHRLEQWLAEQGVTGITGIDTRALTRKLRIDGAMIGVLSTEPLDGPGAVSDEQLVERARKAPGLVGRNMVVDVTCGQPAQWNENLRGWSPIHGKPEPSAKTFNVVAIDCGAKLNILRNLVDSGCQVTVLPYDATAEQIMAYKPDGLFVSNGPGDPSAVAVTIETLRQVRGKLPIFGICLGHQLLALSLGAETAKMKFGHRGGNQPVQNLHTGKVEITSQNHGFAVDRASLERAGGEATHINLNDQTLEGFRHDDQAIFAVQYHPEASPGPHDSSYLFDCFIGMMSSGRAPTAREMDEAQRRRGTLTPVAAP